MTNLGAAFAEQRHFEESLRMFEQVLRSRPESAEAHVNTALLHDRLGYGALAVQHMRRALGLRENWIRAQRMLAWILATDPDDSVRNGKEAVELATQACSKTRHAVGRCLDTLAAAFAEAGQFPDAVDAAKLAEKAAEQAGQGSLAEAFRERRLLYEGSKPYRRRPGLVSDD